MSLTQSITNGWNYITSIFLGTDAKDSEPVIPENHVLLPIETDPWLIGMAVTHRTLGSGKIQATVLRDETLYCVIDFDTKTQEFRADLLKGFGGYFQDESQCIYLRNKNHMEQYGKAYSEQRKREREQQIIKQKEYEASQITHMRQSYLSARKLHDQGIRPASETSKHRIAHCWNCKTPLESGVNIECAGCGWIICKCGACGCGYS